MDKITKKRLIIKYLIGWLKEGNYVGCTNLYMGSYWDGVKSDNRYKIKEENIYFVNGDTVYTKREERLRLAQLAIRVDIEGNDEIFPIGCAIDVTDNWRIYLNCKF